MYIHVKQQGNNVLLSRSIENRKGNHRIALREIGFNLKWINISERAKNNWINVKDGQGDSVKRLKISDGYYNFCSLKEAFREFDIELTIDEANLIVTMSFPELEEEWEYVFPRNLARILGFYSSGETYRFSTRDRVDCGIYEYLGDRPINFLIHPLLYVHLGELKTHCNLFDGQPSTILRVLPATKAGFCNYQFHTFGDSQFKELMSIDINSLDVKITNQDREPVVCSDLLMVLEVEERAVNP